MNANSNSSCYTIPFRKNPWMPIGYKILADKKLVYVFGEDRPTIDEQIRLLDSIAQDPQYVAPMKNLVDLRKCEPLGYSAEEISRFSRKKAELKERFQGERTAVVVNNDLDFGVQRIFSANLEPHHLDLNVFRSFDEALKCLDVELEEKDFDLE